MESLEPLLPLKLQIPTHPDVEFKIKSLTGVYASDARSKATREFMEQLNDIARLSGNFVEQMLKEEHLVSSTVSILPSYSQSQPESPLQHSPVSQTEPVDYVSVSSPPPLSVNLSPTAPERPEPSIHTKNLTDFNWSSPPPVMTGAHRILDSLLPPASEMARHLGPQAKPSAYLKLLDSA